MASRLVILFDSENNTHPEQRQHSSGERLVRGLGESGSTGAACRQPRKATQDESAGMSHLRAEAVMTNTSAATKCAKSTAKELDVYT